MITRIEVHGFKTFRQFSIDVEPLQIVAGPNSAGKSNLFDALQLLARLTNVDVTRALGEGRGRIDDQFARLRGGAARIISLAVELLLPAFSGNGARDRRPLTHTRIRYELGVERRELTSGGEDLAVAWELMRPIQQDDDTWMARHPELAQFALYGLKEALLGAGKIDFKADLEGRALQERNGPGGMIRDEMSATMSLPDPSQSTLLRTHGAAFGPHVSAVQRELLGWHFPLVDVLKLRQPSERAAAKTLAADGSNLPTVLAALPAPRVAHIRADMADLVPGVRSLEVIAGKDELWVEVELADGERQPTRVLSDGTLRLLGLLTLIRSSPPGAVIAHEEPENGIFPGRLRELLDRLLVVTAPDGELPVQILLNTHSPVVLSVLRERPRSIVFADLVRHPDGLRMTRMRPIAEGDPQDRGATTISRQEIERLLDMARPEEAG